MGRPKKVLENQEIEAMGQELQADLEHEIAEAAPSVEELPVEEVVEQEEVVKEVPVEIVKDEPAVEVVKSDKAEVKEPKKNISKTGTYDFVPSDEPIVERKYKYTWIG